MTQKDRDKRAVIAELESYLSGNNNVEAPEERKEEKDTLWLGIGRDGVVLSDVAKDEAPVQKERKGNKKLLWLLLLLPIILGIVLFSRIQKNNSMIFVEGGRFMMGSNGEHDWENSVHEVTLSSFWISKYEVTQKEWQEVMGTNPSHFKGNNLPVEYVSWYDVIEYCNKLSIKEGLTPCYSGSGDSISCNWNANGFRLPTEAEWEYAARGGNKSRAYNYSGSNTLGDVAWYDDNSGGKIHPVGMKSPNELGLYDMSGNVFEWCWDWYDSSYYNKSPKRDPRGAASGNRKVLRGGSWCNFGNYCRVALRYDGTPSNGRSIIGFRVSRAIK
ncbi:MAG: formylglycine-generating enzyme family protein [Candidatus Cloacimonetes bacterium]|nr:formylglycine-generating enzyme family protein [Candidatus Cloacimonadota bacterium]